MPSKQYPSEEWCFVTPSERAELVATHGTRKSDIPGLLLDAYLLNCWKAEALTEEVALPYEVINQCRGVAPTTKGTGAWLAEHCALIGATFRDHEYHGQGHDDNKVRRVTVEHLKQGGHCMDLRAKFVRAATEGKVHVVTGEPQAHAPRPFALTYAKDQDKVRRYFERAPYGRYAPTSEHAGRSADIAQAAYGSDENILERVTRQARASFHTAPRYEPSKDRTTCRLFDKWGAWSDLPSDVRRSAMPHWVEVDLSAAYLGIFLRALETNNVKASTSLLAAMVGEDGTGAWDSVLAALEVPPGVKKDHVKEFVYATLFGASEQTAIELLVKAGVRWLDAVQMNETPLAREMRAAYRKLAEQLKTQRYLMDAYGQRAKLAAKGEHSEVVHFVCSTWELRLVAVAYDCVPANHRGAYIALHQHDGVALGHDDIDALPGLVADVQEAIDAECRALGVRSRAVVKAGQVPAREAPAIARVVAFAE